VPAGDTGINPKLVLAGFGATLLVHDATVDFTQVDEERDAELLVLFYHWLQDKVLGERPGKGVLCGRVPRHSSLQAMHIMALHMMAHRWGACEQSACRYCASYPLCAAVLAARRADCCMLEPAAV
jgi:hypothetical protein